MTSRQATSWNLYIQINSLQWWSICLQCRSRRRHEISPRVRKTPWGRAQQPTAAFWPGEPHGQRSLVGCSPWGRRGSDVTEAAEHHGAEQLIQPHEGASPVARWWRICQPGQETQETRVWPLGQEDPLEEAIATHSRPLAWEIPRTEEPGGPQSLGSRGVRPDGTTDQAGAHSARRPQLESASNPSQWLDKDTPSRPSPRL